MDEQLELPHAGLSKENREKVNTRIWIVGDENTPLHKLIKSEGYQVRVFRDGSILSEEISEGKFSCDLIIVAYPYEADFFIQEVHEIPDLSNFPIIVLSEKSDLEQDKKYFEPLGAVCMDYYGDKDTLLSKVRELTKKSKSKNK